MDPGMMMMLMNAISMLNPGGSDAEVKSDYNKGQLGLIDSAINSIRGMGGNKDITSNQNYQQGQNWLSDLFNDPDFFKNFEAPLQRQFEENTVPDLANRFASMGSGGALGSTGFRNQLAREGSNLSTNIAALRGGMQQQGVNQGLQYAQQPISNYQNMLNAILGHPTENNYQPASNPTAPIAGAATRGYFQGQGMNNNNQQKPQATVPGQNPSTY